MAEIIKHKFNKNHIEILTIERPERFYVAEGTGKIQYINYGKTYWKFGYQPNNKNVTEEVIHERRESPLGFYYDHVTVKRHQKDSDYNPNGRVVVTYMKNGIVYQLKFVHEYNGQKIYNREDSLRPWDIYPGDKDFPDHMITSLYDEARLFFVDSSNIAWYDSAGKRTNLGDVRNTVNGLLFGNTEGPKFQTNEEKIIAHGFDPKYSFRKDKEVKK